MKKSIWILLLIAIALRVFLFICCEKSLWLDEAAIALNILDKNYLDFFQPLQYAQSAPPLFLCLTKFLVNIFGDSEKVFRFIPFLASIVSVFLFYYLLKYLFYDKNDEAKKPIAFLFICFVMCPFCFGFQLLYNTIEFKPYILDVLFTILTVLIWFKYLNKNVNSTPSLRKQIFYAFLLVVFPLFSFGAIFPICALLILSILKKRKIFSLILFLGLLIEYLFIFSKINNGTRVYEYWMPYFINYNPVKIPFILSEILRYNFYPSNFTLFSFIMFVAGCIILYKINKRVFIFFVLTICLGFLASFFNFYPLYNRLSLFLYPILLIIVLSPLYNVVFKKDSFKKAIIYIVSFVIVVDGILYNFCDLNIYKREEIKPLLLKMRAEINPQDKIFIFKGAHLTWRYYNRTFKFKNAAYICSYNQNAKICADEIKPFCGKNTCYIIYSSETDGVSNIKLLKETVTNFNYKILLQDKSSILYRIN